MASRPRPFRRQTYKRPFSSDKAIVVHYCIHITPPRVYRIPPLCLPERMEEKEPESTPRIMSSPYSKALLRFPRLK